jgi:CBS domain-containing protein
MDRNVVRVDESTTVADVVKKMLDSGVWSVLVERGQLPVGVITERDIIRRAVARGSSLDKAQVRDIMTSPLITISADASIGEAMELMTEKDIRRLFVLENDKIVGRITQTELFRSNLDVMLELSSMRYQI